ncbi:MAG TPA: ABC transporter substrate-binding protein [Chloroflexota bacterium]|nr:ABC transporter substrate-binding protein [Chloroflexota bacterium]
MPRLLFVLLSALLLAACSGAAAPNTSGASGAGSAAASTRPLQPLTIAYSSPSLTEIPVYIAQQKGFFREEGLDVQVPYIRGSAELAAAVISGNVQVAYTVSEGVLSGAAQGGIQPVIMTMTDDHYAYNVVTRPEIKTFADVAGKTFSIGTGPGTNPDFALTAVLEAHGMKADAVKRVTGGDTATRAAALEGGKVDATLLDPPYDLPIIDKGYNVVSSVFDDVKRPVAGAVLYSTRAYANAHRDQMVGVAKALIKAVRLGKSNPADTKKLITGWTKIEDQRALDRGYEVYFNKLLSAEPYPTVEAVQNSIENSAKARKEEVKLKAEDFIDGSIVKQALKELG